MSGDYDVAVHNSRVFANSGQVPDNITTDRYVRLLKENNLWDSCVFFATASGGVDKDGNQDVAKVYDLKANADLAQGTQTAKPKYNSDGTLLYDGGDKIQSANITDTNPIDLCRAAITVICWVNIVNVGYQFIFDRYNTGDAGSLWYIVQRATGVLGVGIFKGSSGNIIKQYDTTATIEAGWRCLGFTYSTSGGLNLYIDGINQEVTKTTDNANSNFIASTMSLTIGARYSSTLNPYLNGNKTDCAQIYNKVLTDAEMLWNFNNIKYGGTVPILLELVVNPYTELDVATEILKSETHSHTTESDGQIYGAALIDAYASKSYDFLVITDHDSYRPERTPRENGGVKYINTWDWQLFEGEEAYQNPVGTYIRDAETGIVTSTGMITAESVELTRLRHIVLIDTEYSGDTSYTESSALTAVDGTDTIAIMAHPAYPTNFDRATLKSYYDNHSVNNLVGQEVFPCIITEASLTNSRLLWDYMLTDLMPDRTVWGFGASDTHTNESYQCYTEIFAKTKTLAGWKEAIRAGRFTLSIEYLRTGEAKAPKITNVVHSVDNQTITITATGYTTAKWITSNGVQFATGLVLDYATYSNNILKYARLELENEFGKTYSQPFGFKTI